GGTGRGSRRKAPSQPLSASSRNCASSRCPMATSAPPSAKRSPFSLLRTMTRIFAPLWRSFVTTAAPTCPVAPAMVNIASPLWPGPARGRPWRCVWPARHRSLRLVARGVARAPGHPHGHDDEGVGSALENDEGRPDRVPVRAEVRPVHAEVGVGQVRSVEHHMGWVRSDDTFLVRRQALRRQHVIDPRPRRWLEDALGKCVGYEALDLFSALPLGTQLGHLQDAWQVRSRPLSIHTAWLLGGGRRVLDDGREAILAVPDLDVAGLVEDVDRRLARHGRWAGAESQGNLFLSIHERRRLAPGGPRRLSRGGRAHGDLGGQAQQPDAYQ